VRYCPILRRTRRACVLTRKVEISGGVYAVVVRHFASRLATKHAHTRSPWSSRAISSSSSFSPMSSKFRTSDGLPVRSRFHRATAPSLLRHFRDCVKGAPRELYANVLLTAGPVDKDSLVVIQMCYVGPKEQGLEYLQALSSWSGERCELNEVHEKTFLSQQDSVAQVLRGKRGNQWFIRSALISSLPDEVINKTVLEFADTPVGCSESPPFRRIFFFYHAPPIMF